MKTDAQATHMRCGGFFSDSITFFSPDSDSKITEIG